MIKSTNCSLYLQILSIFTDPIKNALSFRSLSAYNISITFDGKSTMVYPSGNTIAVGDYYGIAVNGQAVVVKNASISSASSKGITPIAVVFSTTTSSTDQGHGWTHGYAISLNDATSGAWKSSSVSLPDLTIWGSEGYKYSTMKDFLDGYTETMTIKNTSGYSSSTYPLCYNALNYSIATPKSSTGWYLPSVGQWHHFLYNLGRYTETPLNNNTSWWYFAIGTGLSAINSYFTKVGGTLFAQNCNYGCSSCLTTDEACCLSITDQYIGIDEDGPLNYYEYTFYCRPVLAF